MSALPKAPRRVPEGGELMADISDWIDDGPPCMNCGERVPDAEIIPGKDGIAFKGICKSNICRELPPGGNPFMYLVS